MQPDKDVTRIYHMWEAATEVLAHMHGRTRDDLETKRLLQLALVRLFEIIGEAAANVSETCRRQLPDVPWTSIIGMRNRMIHAYFNVNLDVVWMTAVDDLPRLIHALEPFLIKTGYLKHP